MAPLTPACAGTAQTLTAFLILYLGQGGNLIDCAHVYSDWVPDEKARAERVLGDWLTRSGKRNEVTLITKGGHPDMVGPER
ncbi:MAG: aldo/keto reductase [Oscillospiraceae bacterium]